jgi:hypothetical protein
MPTWVKMAKCKCHLTEPTDKSATPISDVKLYMNKKKKGDTDFSASTVEIICPHVKLICLLAHRILASYHVFYHDLNNSNKIRRN